MRLDRCKAAAVQGMQEAGFVNVSAEHRAHVSDSVAITVQGDCPCGLGTSRMGLVLTPVNAWPDRVHALVYKSALKHIEEDRAEGRWKD